MDLTKEERLRKFHEEHVGGQRPFVDYVPTGTAVQRRTEHRFLVKARKELTLGEKEQREKSAKAEKDERIRNLKLANRIDEISRHLLAGKNLSQIGGIIGVSRERVRQMAEKHIPHIYSEVKAKRRYKEPRICAREGCGKTFTFIPSKPRKYCSRGCMRKYATPEELRRAMLIRQNNRYHNDPVYRAKHLELTKAYTKRRMTTDPEYRKRTIAYQMEYHRKRMANDPVYRQRKLAYARAQYHRRRIRLLSNPEEMERFMEATREASRRQQEKKAIERSAELTNTILSAARRRKLI